MVDLLVSNYPPKSPTDVALYGRSKEPGADDPGRPYSVVAALEPGRTSWTAVLDAVRLGPHNETAEVTATHCVR